jgi:putative MATE family efflux protein
MLSKKRGFSLDARELLAIALPVSLQSLIQSFLGMIDQIMVGQLGDVAVAGVGIGNRPAFIMLYALFGITTAASIYASQYAGSGEKGGFGKVMQSTFASGFVVALVFASAGLAAPEMLASLFTSDSSVVEVGATFIRITALSYLPLMVTLSCSSMLRSTGYAHVPLFTGMASVAVNTGLNAVLIFGLFGFPSLGVAGTAIATLAARSLEAVALVVVMQVLKVPGRPSEAFAPRFDSAFFGVFMITALPAMANELFWALGDAAYSVIYGHMGTKELASMTLTYPVQSLTIGFFTGFSTAAGIMLGGRLGANDFEKAKKMSWDFFRLGVKGCVAIGIAVSIFAGSYSSLYRVSDDVRSGAMTIIWIFSGVLWIKVSNMIMLGGVLRSGGQTKYTLFLDMLGTWGIGIPLGLLGAFALKLPLPAVYAMITLEEGVRLVLGMRRVASGKWMRKLQ